MIVNETIPLKKIHKIECYLDKITNILLPFVLVLDNFQVSLFKVES